MRRAERLFRLVSLMRAERLSKAEDLAQSLEVSVRTIYRDIAHLQGSGVPIDGEAGVGYVLDQGFDLPPMTLTYEQIDAIALGLSFIEEAGDTALIQAAKEVRGKLSSTLPNVHALTQAPLFAARRGLKAPEFTQSIRAAIRERKEIELDYADGQGHATTRQVQPLALTVFTEGWMFAAWCLLRQDFRYFRLDRIRNLTVTLQDFESKPGQGIQALRKLQAERRFYSEEI